MTTNDGNIVIMNFTGAYELEHFYQDKHTEWIDCKDISGTYGYCDEAAIHTIKERISPYSPYGIHFIDSGNYHYVSKFWTDMITVPFTLCVFDHHPDMQPSLFENLLSCGDWVKEVLDSNPYLHKVIIIGASDSLIKEIPAEYKDRLILFGEDELSESDSWISFAKEHVSEPVYLSIDKDVITSDEVITDWDQGSLTLSQLKLLLYLILEKEVVLGADICGECSRHLSELTYDEILLNDWSNRDLLTFLLEMKEERQAAFL